MSRREDVAGGVGAAVIVACSLAVTVYELYATFVIWRGGVFSPTHIHVNSHPGIALLMVLFGWEAAFSLSFYILMMLAVLLAMCVAFPAIGVAWVGGKLHPKLVWIDDSGPVECSYCEAGDSVYKERKRQGRHAHRVSIMTSPVTAQVAPREP